ncbi:MAG TPA: extracellular solute-binding protein, partial [Mycobacterium sp.]|nr:extracellular solute-binding protein [Mycobacterium sp.]
MSPSPETDPDRPPETSPPETSSDRAPETRIALKSSTLVAIALIATMALLLAVAELLNRTAQPTGATVVTVRLWDPQVAAAYRKSFAAFEATHPGITVRINVVAYSTYFNTLRTDVAG